MTYGGSKTLFAIGLIILVHSLTDLLLQAKAAPITRNVKKDMLHRYEILASVDRKDHGPVSSLRNDPTSSSVISIFKKFTGTRVTGTLDVEMIPVTNLSRCGVPDNVQHGTGSRMKRRAFRDSRWNVTDLTYGIRNYPTKLDRAFVDKEIGRAFSLWSKHTDLIFTRRKTGKVDIEIGFYRWDHGDCNSFDGPGNTLAHAFSPKFGGAVHFDEDETWTIESFYGFNLFQVAVHEFGHALGLGHSSVKSSVMHPYYERYVPNLKLDDDDILRIQTLYRPKTEKAPKICEDTRVDAMLTTADGDIFAFKGNYYWKLMTNEIQAEQPKLISEKWKGLPGNIDAAFAYKAQTYFFKGSRYWRYGNTRTDEEPSSSYISEGFPGVPDDLDAATVWTGDEKLYFFKGERFWRYDGGQRAHPESISQWEGLPGNLDAAVVHEGYTFFFKGDLHYRFNDQTLSVDQGNPPFPRPNGGWFDCAYPNE